MVCAIYVFCSAWLFLLNISPRKAVSSPAVMCLRGQERFVHVLDEKREDKRFHFRDFQIPQLSSATRSMIWRSFVSPPTSTWWEISTGRPRRTGKSVNFLTLTYQRGVQWAWINRLDVAERAITQDEGLGPAEGLRGHFCTSFFFFVFHFPGPRSIATDLKPRGHVLLNKSDVSPRDQTCLPSGTGETF